MIFHIIIIHATKFYSFFAVHNALPCKKRNRSQCKSQPQLLIIYVYRRQIGHISPLCELCHILTGWRRSNISLQADKWSIPKAGTYIPSAGTYVPYHRTYIPSRGTENIAAKTTTPNGDSTTKNPPDKHRQGCPHRIYSNCKSEKKCRTEGNLIQATALINTSN